MSQHENLDTIEERIYAQKASDSEIKRHLKKHCPIAGCESIRGMVALVQSHEVCLEEAIMYLNTKPVE